MSDVEKLVLMTIKKLEKVRKVVLEVESLVKDVGILCQERANFCQRSEKLSGSVGKMK